MFHLLYGMKIAFLANASVAPKLSERDREQLKKESAVVCGVLRLVQSYSILFLQAPRLAVAFWNPK